MKAAAGVFAAALAARLGFWRLQGTLPLVGDALEYDAFARSRELLPLSAAVLCSITVFIFFGGPVSRYRQGVALFIVLLAVIGMKAVHDVWGRTRFCFRTSAWLAANLLIWLCQAQARQLVLWLRAFAWGR